MKLKGEKNQCESLNTAKGNSTMMNTYYVNEMPLFEVPVDCIQYLMCVIIRSSVHIILDYYCVSVVKYNGKKKRSLDETIAFYAACCKTAV